MKSNYFRLGAVLAITMLLSISALNAQNRVSKATNTKNVKKEEIQKVNNNQVKPKAETKQQMELSPELPVKSKPVIISSQPAQTTNTPKTRVSDYLSMEKKIMAWTVAGDIPSSLPKHVEGQSEEQYKSIILNWAKNNLDLIKPEYHQKITSNTK